MLDAGLLRTFDLKTASSAKHRKVRNGCILKSLCLGHGGASAGARDQGRVDGREAGRSALEGQGEHGDGKRELQIPALNKHREGS